ncbi:MAG: hypothetical protein AB7S38_34090 [Vulcanimicrobiota bacterium]
MSSIYLPAELKRRLVEAARKRGYVVERGRQSQLVDYIAYLVEQDEQRSPTFERALGLLAGPQAPPDDEAIERLLAQRRLEK